MCGYATFKSLNKVAALVNAKPTEHFSFDDTYPAARFLHAGDTVGFIVHREDTNWLSSGIWGTTSGFYNARHETMGWQWPSPRWQRAIVRLGMFHEGGGNFISPSPLVAACVANVQERVVLCTRDSSPEVKIYHHRMPFFLSSDEIDEYLHGVPVEELSQYVPVMHVVNKTPVETR